MQLEFGESAASNQVRLYTRLYGILSVPYDQIFQVTDMVTYSTFSTVKSMWRLNSYSDTVSYVSTGLNT